MNAGLGDYMQKFVLIQPGDWPCQFYCRQIIYHCLKKFISFTPMCAPVNQEHSLHDHSTYSYPSIAGSDKEESLEVNLTSQPCILSVIPTIGPLHISRRWKFKPKWRLDSSDRLLPFFSQDLSKWCYFMPTMQGLPRKAHSNGISNEQCRDPQLEKGCHKLLDGNAPNVLAGKVQSWWRYIF